MTSKLDNALGLYMDGIRDGNVREAITKYTGDRYTQHSTGVADGPEGFIAFFDAFIQRVPARDLRVVRAIEDERYVFCHVSQDLNKGEARWITTDLFDTDENGKIIEHWDVIAPWQTDAEIDGPTEVVDLPQTQANKALVEAFITTVLIGGAGARATEFVAPDLVQHEHGIESGASTWIAHLADTQTQYREVFRLIAQGNFVVSYCKVDVAGAPHAIFDILRVEAGRIVERWSNAEVVPDDTGNSGKF